MSLTEMPLKPKISLDRSPGPECDTAEALVGWAREHQIEEIECVMPDMAGIARGKVMPASKFVRGNQVRLPTSTFFATITGEYVWESEHDLDADSDLYLVPDLATARAVPWASDRSLQVIHDVNYRDGSPVPYAPREVLRRVINQYAELGWKPIVAPELEFYLTKPNTDADYPLEPPEGRSGRQSLGNQAYSLSAVDEHDRVIEHIYDYADAQGLEIDTIIQESGAAQLEVNLLHGDAMALADQVFLFKRLIREAALRCGCYATFMAKPMEQQPGSAMHIHQSLVDLATGENVFSGTDGKETDIFMQFIGGQQKYIGEVMCLLAPYVNSYRRLVPDLSAPINLEWGMDNRSTGLRAPYCEPGARRLENRVVGADANPYLAIAACLACGLAGIRNKVEPRPRFSGNSYERGRDLPYALLEAVEILRGSLEMRKILGDDFVSAFISVKLTEHDAFMKVISPWEREYLLLNV